MSKARSKRELPSGGGDDRDGEVKMKDVCLFCLTDLPLEMENMRALETLVPHGPDLALSLDNPAKNKEAFDFLCSMLYIKWINRGTVKFDRGQGLPLCIQCQNLYQEFYQLQLQIRELGRLMKERLGLITGMIKKSGRRVGKGGLRSTRLEEYGLDYLREKVIITQTGKEDDPKDCTADTRNQSNRPTTSSLEEGGNLEASHLGGATCDSSSSNQIAVPNERGNIKIRVIPRETEVWEPMPLDEYVVNEVVIDASDIIEDEGAPTGQDDDDAILDSEYDVECEDVDKEGSPERPTPKENERRSGRRRSPEKICRNSTDDSDDDSASEPNNSNGNDDKNDDWMEDQDDDDNDEDEEFSGNDTRRTRGLKRITIMNASANKKSSAKSTLGSNPLKSQKGIRQRKGAKNKIRRPTGYTCHICEKTISSGRNDFLQHYEDEHPDEKRYTCKFCKEHFKGLWEIRLHQQKHTGEKPHECGYCPKRFSTKKARNNHQKWVHEGTGKRFSCETCGKLFPTRSLLKTHELVHNETIVFCKMCGKSYKSQYSFNKHNKENHDGKAECSKPILNPTEEDVEALGLQTDASTKTACHICWKNIHGKINIKKHFDQVHDGHPPLKCSKCGKQFSYYKEVRKHVLRHIGLKSLQCDKCPKKFHTRTELRNHSVTHLSDSEKPKYVCEICGVSYSAKNNLYLHYKLHEGNKSRWVCEICGKSYSERKGYQHHKKSIHLNETPHKCSFCPKSFVGPSELVKHLRIHSGQKPFKCPLCDKYFPYTNSRARHVREVHHNEKNRNRNRKSNKQTSAVATSLTPPLDDVQTTESTDISNIISISNGGLHINAECIIVESVEYI